MSPWTGYSLSAWVKMLAQYRFAVSPQNAHRVLGITLASGIHSALAMVEKLVHGDRIRNAVIDPPPVFVIGHWRTGTTHLHELLTQDTDHTFPNTYECFDPNHFLLTEGTTDKALRFLLPERRPMDNMAVGFERPQEDEFALCGTGVGSPYLRIAFPNSPLRHEQYLDLEGLSARELEKWKDGFMLLLRRLSAHRPGRLILKSPAHSCRVKVLNEMFPDALFVHIVRNPYDVFPSTVHLWKRLIGDWALQKPHFGGLEDYVFDTYLHVYRKLDEARELVDPARFHELRYEDLIEDPVREMRAIYERLALGDFEKARPSVEKYLAGLTSYKTNKYKLTEARRAEITRRWGTVIKQYGYSTSSD